MLSPIRKLLLNTQSGNEALSERWHRTSSRETGVADLDLLEAGSHSVAKHPVAVQDLQPLQTADLHFRGIVGGDFLGHFDVLMDYAHRMLCLDDTKVMQAAVKGGHIALVTRPETPDDLSLTVAFSKRG